MKTPTAFAAAVLALAGASAFAAGKPFDELKTRIAAKLDARNVIGCTLDVVESGKVGDAEVVGTCDGGANKITCAKK